MAATTRRKQISAEGLRLSAAICDIARYYQLRRRDKVCRHRLTVTECYALEAIAARGTLTVKEIGVILGADKSTGSRVVEQLRAADLVRVESDSANARYKKVSATAEGRKLAARIEAEIRAEHAEVFAGFSSVELQRCTRLLQAVLAGSTSRPAPGSGAPAACSRPGSD